MTPRDLERRLVDLEASLRRTRRTLAAAVAIPLLMGAWACATPLEATVERPRELVASRLTVVDETGAPRIVIGPDKPGARRISQAAGLIIFDRTGAERGGFGTMDDGSVRLAMDAPRGVGADMRDRLGMMVAPDGSAQILLIDNQTRGQVRLASNADGEGAVQFFRWEPDEVQIRSLTFAGERQTAQALGK